MSNQSTNADDGMLVLTFYFVADVSLSMSGEPIAALNHILPEILDAIAVSPTLGDVVRLGVIDFSDEARIVLRLSDLRDITVLPSFTVRGGTSYAAAFRALRHEIEYDVALLKSDGFKVYRPAVFFVTDGDPTDSTDELNRAFAELTDPAFRARPNIIPFGVGSASKEGLDHWVFPKPSGRGRPMRSYIAGPNLSPADALRQIAEILISSVIASANSVSSGGIGGGFILPDPEDLHDWR